MTREELLEHNIYCPEKIDNSIYAYLNMNFNVLVRCVFYKDCYIPILIGNFEISPYFSDKIPISQFNSIDLEQLTIVNGEYLFYNHKHISSIHKDCIQWTL